MASAGTAVFRAIAQFGPAVKGAKELSDALGGVDQKTKSAEESMGKAGKTGEGFGSKLWSGAKKTLKVGALAAGAAAGGLFATALAKGMGRLVAIDTARGKLRGLGHDAEAVESIMKDALASVKGTAFGMDEAATTAAGAVAAGIKPGKELTRYLSIVADTAAIAGISMADMGSTMNRVQTAGVAMSEDIGTLGDKGIPIMTWLAEAYGVTTAEMKKMVSEGKVDAATYAQVLEDNIGGAALAMGDTFAGALKNTWAAVGRVGANLLSGVFPYFQQGLNQLMTWLEPLEDVASRVGDALGRTLARGIEFVTDAWKGLSSAWGSGAGIFGGLQALVRLFQGRGTGGLAQYLNVPQNHPTIKVLLGIRDLVTKGIPAGLRTVRDLFVGVFNVLTGQGTGLLAKALGVDEGHWIIDAIRGVREVALDLIDFVTGTAVPALMNFIQQFRDGEGAGGVLRDALTGIWQAAVTAFDYIGSTVVPLISDLYNWFKKNEEIVVALAAGVLAYKGYMLLLTGITKAVTAATAIWTGVQKALNVVMNLNPIGILIAAIAALIAVVIYAYKENDKFRAIVDKAWAGIKSAIFGVVNWFRNTAWPWMRDTFSKLGNAVQALWTVNFKPYFTSIWDLLKAVGGWIKDTLWPWIRDSFSSIVTKAGELRDKVVDRWNKIKDGISSGWDAIKKTFDRFKEGLNSVRDRFRTIRDSIRTIWATIGGAVARPINTVIDSVNKFLENIRTGINKIPGVNLGGNWGRIPQVPVPSASTGSSGGYAGGYQPGRYADGGTVRGRSSSERADNIPAWLTADEEVIRRRAARRMRRQHPGALEHINKHGTLPGYAKGGTVGRKPRTGDGPGLLESGWDTLVGLFREGASFVKRMILRLLPESLKDSFAGQAVSGIVNNLSFSKIADAILGRANVQSVDGGPAGRGGKGLPWQAIWHIIQGVIPGAQKTSDYRRGAVTAGYGNTSLHALGRAVDFVSPNMRAATQLLSMIGKWTELIHTPAGMYQQSNGRRFAAFNAVTRRMHYDHVHVGMSTGGWVPGKGRGDRTPVKAEPGEYMVNRRAAAKWAPLLAAINSGALDSAGTGDLMSLFSSQFARSSLAARSATGLGVGMPVQAGVVVTGDVRITENNVTVNVHNPVREKSYDSVQRNLSRQARFGMITGSAGKD